MATIEHRVALPDGSFANTVGSAVVIDAMYPKGLQDPAQIYIDPSKIDRSGITLTAVNSVLRFQDLPEGKRAISGNTVTRLCPVAQDCGNCALSGAGLSVAEMSYKNCARGNTAEAFELAGTPPEGRFVLLPTGKATFVVDSERLTPEYNEGELLQNRLKAAPSVVFTESWLREQGLERMTVGMNGADGSMGVAITRIEGETIIIAFCSMRQNMGDRKPEDQIIHQALNAYFDSRGFDEELRKRVLEGMNIGITLSASASVANFAHKIKVPGEGPEAPEKERKDAARIRAEYPDLVRLAGDKITSAIVLEDQFKGALTRGNIYPEFEAQLVGRGADLPSPITPDKCPGDGQTCNVDYRRETEYALRSQLQQMGVPEANVQFDDSGVLDPSDHSNNAASNRAEQNEGVEVANTNRTLNAMTVELAPPVYKMSDQDFRHYLDWKYGRVEPPPRTE